MSKYSRLLAATVALLIVGIILLIFGKYIYPTYSYSISPLLTGIGVGFTAISISNIVYYIIIVHGISTSLEKRDLIVNREKILVNDERNIQISLRATTKTSQTMNIVFCVFLGMVSTSVNLIFIFCGFGVLLAKSILYFIYVRKVSKEL